MPELEGLRGVLALWVLAGHWATTVPFPLRPIRQDLWNLQAVDVFVALSGFVIAALVASGRERGGAYLLRRFLRLYPAYVAVLAVSVPLLPYTEAVVAAAPASAMQAARLDILHAGEAWYWTNLLLHLLLAHGLVPLRVDPQAAYAFVGQAWSISLEWQFYLLAPLLLPPLLGVPREGPRRTWPAAACAALLVLPAPWMGQAYIGGKLHLFALGALSFRLWHGRGGEATLPVWPSRVALGALLAATAALRQDRLVGVLCWAAVLHCLLVPGAPEQAVRRVLRHPALLRVGRSSYSLYLVHFLMLVVAMDLVGRLPGGIATVGGAASLLLLTAAASVGVAEAMHRWIELPGMRLAADLGRRPGLAERRIT